MKANARSSAARTRGRRARLSGQGQGEGGDDRQLGQDHGLRQVGDQRRGHEGEKRNREVDQPREVVGVGEHEAREERGERAQRIPTQVPRPTEVAGRRRAGRAPGPARRRTPRRRRSRKGKSAMGRSTTPRPSRAPRNRVRELHPPAQLDECDQPIHVRSSRRTSAETSIEEHVLEARVPPHLALRADLVEAALGDDAAVIDDRHLVAQALRHVQHVGGEEERHALLRHAPQQIRDDSPGYGGRCRLSGSSGTAPAGLWMSAAARRDLLLHAEGVVHEQLACPPPRGSGTPAARRCGGGVLPLGRAVHAAGETGGTPPPSGARRAAAPRAGSR
jgi:hypothetical protein